MEDPAPNTKKSTTATFIVGLALFGLFALASVLLPAIFRKNDYEEDRALVRAETLKATREEVAARASTYAWADKEKGYVQVPLDRAMEIVLPELVEKKPRPSGIKIPPPPAPAAEAPADAASDAEVAPSPAAEPAASPATSGTNETVERSTTVRPSEIPSEEAPLPGSTPAPAASPAPNPDANTNAPAAPAPESAPTSTEAPAQP
jgi:hypothetical protein